MLDEVRDECSSSRVDEHLRVKPVEEVCMCQLDVS